MAEYYKTNYYGALGFLRRPKNSRSLLNHMFPHKAGGVPAWLDSVNLPSDNACLCDVCGDPLQFLLQLHAGYPGREDTYHRAVFVFICASMACLRRHQQEQWKRLPEMPLRSVKVFRCQLPRSNPFYTWLARFNHDPCLAEAELCTWCGTWQGIIECPTCDKVVYCSEKHQIEHSEEGHDCQCASDLSGTSLNDKQTVPVEIKRAVCPTIWPEFEIFEGYEFEYDVEKNSEVSFEDRIAWAPKQVLRYDRYAKPLWPMTNGQPSKADIPHCRYCNGPLCYEFQILPRLLYCFGERNDEDSLNWASIVVYTCRDSCVASLSYKEEFAWVQLA